MGSERYTVLRNLVSIGDASTEDEAFEIIRLDYREKKYFQYVIHDYEKDIAIDASKYVSELKTTALAAKKKPAYTKVKEHKNNRYEPDFLKWLHTQPSVISGMVGDNDPHHVRGKSGATQDVRIDDRNCVSLTREEHTRIHALSNEKFAEYYHLYFPPEMNLIDCLEHEAKKLWKKSRKEYKKAHNGH